MTTFTAGIIKDPTTGENIEISTVSAIGAALDFLVSVIDGIHAVEKTEADAAVRKLKFYHCHHKKAFLKAVAQMEQNMAQALQLLRTIYDTSFVPNDSVPEKLMGGHYAKWTEIMTEVDLVKQDIENQLMLTDWESPGASQYKAALPTQMKALTELRSVAGANQQAVEQVALLNGAIFHATESSFNVAIETLGHTMENFKPKRPKTAFLGLGTGNLKGMYYKNYDLAYQLVTQLGDWMDKIVQSQGSDWAATATNLGSSIKAVKVSPLNLLPDGGWPSSVAQQTPDAYTQALGEHQRAVKEGRGNAQSKGIKLR